MWSFIPLIVQGGLFGFVAGRAFEDPALFFSACIANSIIVVAYGAFKSAER